MSASLLLIVFIILVALLFDYINGFHDAANSIATVVSTRVLSPMQAVAWAAFFNFVAAFGFGVHVATTVGKGVVAAAVVDHWVILAGLSGAIVWDLITWYYGLPTSSSHALIGGFAGAAVVKAGFGSLIYSGLAKIVVFMILAPFLGLALGFGFMVTVYWIFRRVHPGRVDGLFRRLMQFSEEMEVKPDRISPAEFDQLQDRIANALISQWEIVHQLMPDLSQDEVKRNCL